MKSTLTVLGLGVLVVGLIVGGSFGSLWLYKVIAPQWEDARTDVYRNTKSYTEGTIRDLRRLKREYNSADESQKTSLRTIILQRSDEVDLDNVPSDVRRFVEELQ